MKYEVTVPGAKTQIMEWLRDRGGVIVWENINLSDPTKGFTYTPAKTSDGQDGHEKKPHWGVRAKEVVTDPDKFRFAKELKEVKRFRVAVRMGSQGMSLKVTDGGTRRIKAALAKAGPDSCYEFDYDTQEAVILVPVWEAEDAKQG
jgi:hypothetical protein